MEPRKLKRVVIKEELVALTGDPYKAVILNQFLYWSERVRDFDEFIQEESQRLAHESSEAKIDLLNGWIWKKAEQLIEETMLSMSRQSVARHIDELVSKGWVLRRHNPVHAWDRTWQYRVDLIKLQNDLHAIGFTLEGYTLNPQPYALSNLDIRRSNMNNRESNMDNRKSELDVQYQRLQTDITSEITSDNNSAHQDDGAEQANMEHQVDDIVVVVEQLIGIKVKKTEMTKWLSQHGAAYVLEKARYIRRNIEKYRSPLGSLRSAITDDWETGEPPSPMYSGGKQYGTRKHSGTNKTARPYTHTRQVIGRKAGKF